MTKSITHFILEAKLYSTFYELEKKFGKEYANPEIVWEIYSKALSDVSKLLEKGATISDVKEGVESLIKEETKKLDEILRNRGWAERL